MVRKKRSILTERVSHFYYTVFQSFMMAFKWTTE